MHLVVMRKLESWKTENVSEPEGNLEQEIWTPPYMSHANKFLLKNYPCNDFR